MSAARGTEGVTRLHIARHPETEANVTRRFVGRGDTAYTALGRSQAADLVDALAAFVPDVVLSSPSRRCADVALPVAERLGIGALILDDLAELDFGDVEGLTYAEASRLGIDMDLLGGPSDQAAFPAGERWNDFEARVSRAWTAALEAGDRVAIVTHSGVVRSLMTLALGLPAEAAWRFAVAPASSALLTVGPDYSILEAFGLPPEAISTR